jgi:hypothetical protein
MLSPSMKRPRRDDDTPIAKRLHRRAISALPTLTSTYDSPASRSGPRFKSRAGQFLVELRPEVRLAFHGLSPIKSFLASSSHPFNPRPGADSGGVKNVNLYETRDEHVNYRIIHGVKHDSYPRDGVPYYMLYDGVSADK